MKNQKQERIFTETPVWNAIIQLSVPVIFMMVIMIAYNMADMFFVGKLHDDAQVAAVSIIGPMFSLIMALGNMLGSGGCALIARTMGEGDTSRVKRYSTLCCWGGLILGALATVLIIACHNPLLKFLGANQEIMGYARQYLIILAFGAPFMVFSSTFGNVLRSVGAIKEGMIAGMLGTVLNVILDPILILYFKMGIPGAALATVIGNMISSLFVVIVIMKKSFGLSLSIKVAAEKPSDFLKIVYIGLPNLASTALASFGGAFANNMLIGYGTTAVAAMAAAGKATMLISMIQMGLCMGVNPLMAYNYGARNTERLREVLIKLAMATLTIGLVLTLLCGFNAPTLVGMFLTDASSIDLSQKMLKVIVLAGPFYGLFYLGTNYLQAVGNAKMATLISVLQKGVFLVPMLIIMNRVWGLGGNVCANLVADIAAALVSVAFTLAEYKRPRAVAFA